MICVLEIQTTGFVSDLDVKVEAEILARATGGWWHEEEIGFTRRGKV